MFSPEELLPPQICQILSFTDLFQLDVVSTESYRFVICSKYNQEEPCVYQMHIICIHNKTGAQGNYFSDPLFQHQDRLVFRRKNSQKPNIENLPVDPKDPF